MYNRTLRYGVGINDCPTPVRQADGSLLESYTIWSAMLQRCYSEAYQKRKPTYVGCEVHPSWFSFMTYKCWYDDHVVDGWQVDKDILVRDNKMYSPETCVFVPSIVNSIYNRGTGSVNGTLPIGVFSYTKGKTFTTHVSKSGKQINCGTYSTIQEAFNVYCIEKVAYSQGVLDTFPLSGRVKQAVMDTLHHRLGKTAEEFNLQYVFM